MEPQYKFTPLPTDSDHFRLIRLLPGEQNATIRLSLQTVKLGEVPYVALSYCWGQSEDLKTIEVNGQIYYIRLNLGEILTELASSQLLDDRLLFVDAICIDQQNVSERNSQVSLMGKIYSSAEEVLSWLGRPANRSDQLLLSCKTVEEAMIRFWNRPYGCSQSLPPHQEYICYAIHGREFRKLCFKESIELIYGADGYGQFRKDLKVFLDRDYWQRVWVVQEVLLAKKITVTCGRFNLSMETLGALLNDLGEFDKMFLDHPTELILEENRKLEETVLLPIGHYRNMVIWASNRNDPDDGTAQVNEHVRHNLTALLAFYGGRKCSNVLDAVYGLFGLTQDTSNHIRSRRRDGAGLIVDYSRTPLWIFFRVLAVHEAHDLVHCALLLRKDLKIEYFIPVLPITEQLRDCLEMSEDEMHSPIFCLTLEEHQKLGQAIRRPENVAHNNELVRIYKTAGYRRKDIPEDSFVSTFADADDNDILFAIGGYQVAAALIMRCRMIEKPTIECQDEKWEVLNPGILERTCIGIAVVKTPRQELDSPTRIWQCLPNMLCEQLSELSKLPIGSMLGRQEKVCIDQVNENGEISVSFELSCSWLEMLSLIAEHWLDT